MKVKTRVRAHGLTIGYRDNELCIDHFITNYVNTPFLDINWL